ncbi:MAG: hypothetical protein KY450_11430 [Actinobacteria bacterium]|nr:hypothetical protein [Actinomycetota bacterium]
MGRRGWLRTGEGFGVFFGLFAHLAPFWRDDQGTLRVRPPFAGLAELQPDAGTAAVVLVVLGGTSFDGVTRTQQWLDATGSPTGWERTIVNTVGMVWCIGMVALLYAGAMKVTAMITDGEPTAHLEAGMAEAFFQYPPVQATVDATLAEVNRCTREGIRINTFMLDATDHLRRFVEHLTRINRGRAFFTTPDTLGDYVLVDFLDQRRSAGPGSRRHRSA